MNPENIPTELKEYPQWVGWVSVPREGGKTDKIPIDPQSLRRASVTDPKNWGTFDQALGAVSKLTDDGPVVGVGFVFTKDDPFSGVDLDGVRPNGVIKKDAWERVKRLSSYTEMSPSETGLHVILKATKPSGECRKGKIEIYDRGRFFTMTGDRPKPVNSLPSTVEHRQAELEKLCGSIFQDSPRDSQEGKSTDLDFTLDPEAKLPAQMLQSLRSISKFLIIWERADLEKRKSDGDDVSDSSYDARLAFFLFKQGHMDQLVCVALAHNRSRFDAKSKRGRLDYYKRTLTDAKRKAKKSIDGGPLKDLNARLQLPGLEKVVKRGKGDADPFELIFDDGSRVTLEDVTSPHVALRQLAHSMKPMGSYFTKPAWNRQVVPLIVAAAEVVETTSEEEETWSWIERFTESNWNVEVDLQDREELAKILEDSSYYRSFHDKQGRIYFRLLDLVHYVLKTVGQRTSQKNLSQRLSRIGFTKPDDQRLQVRTRGGKIAKGRFWISPQGTWEKFSVPEKSFTLRDVK